MKSPINSIIIGRCVEEGQTVFADYNTPVLYTNTKEHNRNEMLVSVVENHIRLNKSWTKSQKYWNSYFCIFSLR